MQLCAAMEQNHTTVDVVVEIPRGSRNKYEYDHDKDVFRLDRRLFSATVYPADYGFIPHTLAEDGDPLDAMALVSEPTFPGCRVRIRPIGAFLMKDRGESDHKILGVPLGDPIWRDARSLDDVPPHILRELEHFFSIYKDLEEAKTDTLGWIPLDQATAIIESALAAYVG